MLKLKNMVMTIGFAIATTIIAPAGFAQSYLVVDTTRVLQESKAGKDIGTKISQIEAAMNTELAPEGNALKTEKAAIDNKIAAAQAQGKSEEEIFSEPTLAAQGQAYSRKVQTFMNKSAKREKELQITEQNAAITFSKKLAEVVEGIRVERGADLIFNRSQVYIMKPELDITSDVIAKMDEVAPTLPVTRVTLPDAPPKAQQ